MTNHLLVDNPNRVTPQGGWPRRGVAAPSGTCIVHTSEGPWQNGVNALTQFIRTRSDYGSYHRACDWADIAVYYPWEWEAWQDSETNPWAVGIAAACRTSDWAIMPADIREGYYRNMGRMAADFVAYMRDTHGVHVPLRRITGAQARARVPGFAAHGDSGVARSDPGADFDWSYFFHCTQEALGAGSIAPQSGNITPAKPKPKEWDEMASKNDIKTALREVIAEPATLDKIALALLKRDCHLVDPSGKTGKITGTTTLAKKVNWMAHNDAQQLSVLVAIGEKLGLKLDELIEMHEEDAGESVPELLAPEANETETP